MESDVGLPRALSEGDAVILTTGATATVRRDYPAGYKGDIEIMLDGEEEKERASGLTLPDETPVLVDPAFGDAPSEQQVEMREMRAPSRRMEH